MEQAFKDAVNDLYKEKYPDVCNMILNHSMKHIFIDNLCAQFKGVEDSTVKLDKVKIRRLTKDFVKMFGHRALSEKEEQLNKGMIKQAALDTDFLI